MSYTTKKPPVNILRKFWRLYLRFVFRPLSRGFKRSTCSLWHLYLFFRYFGKGLKFHQLVPYHCLRFFVRLFQKLNIKHSLGCGTLLGVVRNKSFAGGPQDIDFIIEENSLEKFKEEISSNLMFFVFYHADIVSDGRIQIYPRVCDTAFLVDIEIRSSLNPYLNSRKVNCSTLSSPKRFGQLYDIDFEIPFKAEEILQEKYGEDWKIPTRTQFPWYKNISSPVYHKWRKKVKYKV